MTSCRVHACPDTINRLATPITCTMNKLKPGSIVQAAISAANNQNYASLVTHYAQLCLCLKSYLLLLKLCYSIICQALVATLQRGKKSHKSWLWLLFE